MSRLYLQRSHSSSPASAHSVCSDGGESESGQYWRWKRVLRVSIAAPSRSHQQFPIVQAMITTLDPPAPPVKELPPPPKLAVAVPPFGNVDWDIKMARDLMIEFVGGEPAAQLPDQFAVRT
jgi:hypothetical protein